MPTDEEINHAIRDCLDECYKSDSPITCLAEFIQKLSTRTGWTSVDVGRVQQKALRMLTILLEPPDVVPDVPPASSSS